MIIDIPDNVAAVLLEALQSAQKPAPSPQPVREAAWVYKRTYPSVEALVADFAAEAKRTLNPKIGNYNGNWRVTVDRKAVVHGTGPTLAYSTQPDGSLKKV